MLQINILFEANESGGAEVSVGDPLAEPKAYNTASISPQQRHVWNNAQKIPQGQPGCIPEVFFDKFRQAAGPKQRAAIINKFVPRDCQYGELVQWKPAHIARFISGWNQKTDTTQLTAMSYTDIRAELGRGDLEAGARAVEEGLANGDIKKVGNEYMRRQRRVLLQQGERHEHKQRSSGKSSASWNQLADHLCSHQWAEFAICNTRQSELADGHSEMTSKPPSEEAMAHLNVASEKVF